MNFQLMDIVTTLSGCNACFVFNTQNLYRVNDHIVYILQSPSNHLIFKTYILLSPYTAHVWTDESWQHNIFQRGICSSTFSIAFVEIKERKKRNNYVLFQLVSNVAGLIQNVYAKHSFPVDSMGRYFHKLIRPPRRSDCF